MTNEHETCGRCGRKLKQEKSRQIGFGPVCKKKHDEAIAWDKAATEQENAQKALENQTDASK